MLITSNMCIMKIGTNVLKMMKKNDIFLYILYSKKLKFKSMIKMFYLTKKSNNIKK
jgi:hypothetical protein